MPMTKVDLMDYRDTLEHNGTLTQNEMKDIINEAIWLRGEVTHANGVNEMNKKLIIELRDDVKKIYDKLLQLHIDDREVLSTNQKEKP